ncbi:hypothetical protein [Candidatus Villigracilis affinis]|uniref:hypothetical protein n=1 Tax=Candidatus Villigracilis affinis TaxID=3140682 RepID=UPI001DC8FBF8|nr:hypothetical protein [Anaerolineales bacterium]
MKIFRVPLKRKILSLIAFLMMLSVFLFLAYTYFTFMELFASIKDGNVSLGIWFALFVVFFAVMTAWIAVVQIAEWKARLIFDDEQISLETIAGMDWLLQRGLKPFSVKYGRVRSLMLGVFGTVEIIEMSGAKYTLTPLLFGNRHGEDIVIELKNRVPPEAIAPSMKDAGAIEKWHRQSRNISAITSLIAALYLLVVFLEPPHSWFINIWETETRFPWFESVDEYSVDPQGGFWVISQGSKNYHVFHIPKKKDNAWEWKRESAFGTPYPKYISVMEDGTPLIWLDTGVLRYVVDHWKEIPFENDQSVSILDGMVSGRYGWFVDRQGHVVRVDALTGIWSELALPEMAEQRGLSPVSASPMPDGDLLVLMRNDTESRVYRLSNGKWTDQEIPIIQANGWAKDYFLDGDNALWVLLEVEYGNFVVEKIDSLGSVLLTQLPESLNNEERVIDKYRALMVDSLGRLWMYGVSPSSVVVFEPAWNDNARELVRYTENNSNFQNGTSFPPVMTADGKIWSFDDQIISMDTNLRDLPRPMPSWYALLDWNTIRLILLFSQIAVLYFPLILRSLLARKKK